MKKPFIGVLFVIGWSVFSYGFAADWEQLFSIVVLCSIAAFMHIRSIEYIPTVRFSLAMVVVVPLISFHGTEWTVLSALAMVVFNNIIFELKWQSLISNCLSYGASTLLAGVVFGLFGGRVGLLLIPESLLPLIMSAVAYSSFNALFSSLNYTRKHEVHFGEAFKRIISASWLNYLMITYIGTLFAVFAHVLGLLGLVMFGVLLIGFMELLQVNTKMHSERNRRLEVEQELAIDPKTKVYNFRYLHEWLSDETDSRSSVLFIDIDNFKEFNDRYGHDLGDQALKIVADTIIGSVREMDRVVRFGGEEFVVVVPGADGENALIAAERVRAQIQEATKLKLNLAITVSIGVASLPNAQDKHDLLVLADQAMYKAKNLGKNRCYLWDGKAAS